MSALGTWVTIPLVILVNRAPSSPWLPENVDDGRLELYFLLLGAIMAADLAFHAYFASRYEYVDKDYLAYLDSANNEDAGPYLPRRPQRGGGTSGEGEAPAFRSGRFGADKAYSEGKPRVAAYSVLHHRGNSTAEGDGGNEEEPAPEADGSYLMDGSEAGAVAARHVLRDSSGGVKTTREKKKRSQRTGGFSSVALNDTEGDDDLQEIELSTI